MINTKFGSKSKEILLIVLLIFSIAIKPALAWGDEGHKIINKMSVKFFPPEMKAFIAWQNYLAEHAPDPDNRKKTDKTESPKHFIDIDFYKEFNAGKMIENEDSLISEYGKSEVVKNGILPWATLESFQNLTKAFKDHNTNDALKYAADLGHYVADGHQPMHTVVNYNGQLTDQKGVHARYEINMVDDHLPELEKCFQPIAAPYVKDPEKFIFNYISDANSVCEVLFDADNLAYKESTSRRSDEYYKLMWSRTGYITEVQFNHAAEDLASLIYTAWVNAGKPSFKEMK